MPPTLLFIPLSQIVSDFGLYNSYWALILVYPTFLIPFASWLLMGYFRTISRELEDAALVDGATRLQAMTRIVLPLAIPACSRPASSASRSPGTSSLRLVFMGSGDMKTVPVGVVSDLIRADLYFWGSLMAQGFWLRPGCRRLRLPGRPLRLRSHRGRDEGLGRSRGTETPMGLTAAGPKLHNDIVGNRYSGSGIRGRLIASLMQPSPASYRRRRRSLHHRPRTRASYACAVVTESTLESSDREETP